ncbi:putative oxygenase [Burkholderia sp. AU4i]|nr:putative oxygenase [Burkholderia sp. AU4i]
MWQEPIGYANVNDGDIFQDIHPKRDLVASQSQKALKPIFFHKDLANHFVRPDWVNILGLRSSTENEVYTSFVRNKDLLNELDSQTQAVLRRPEFYTPFDDLTMYKSAVQLGNADMHPILGGATPTDFRFFENRTEGQTPAAKLAVARLVDVLHRLKKRVLIQPGDLIGSANNDCLHNKDVGTIRDEKALKERWLMKTVNVRSLQDHHAHFIEGRPRIVHG